ncbi:LUD domain-containing protein (plasmid) [Haloferacaceae archaeon DSL9]
MSASLLGSLEERALELGITASREPKVEVTDTLTALAEEPAIGSRLEIEGVSLPTFVNTEPSEADLHAAKTGITSAAFAIADYGSVIVTPTENREGSVSLFPPLHIAVVAASDVLPTMDRGFDRLAGLFASGRDDAVFVTGPSSTGDMGGLVRGVHGPAEMHILIVEDA